MKTIQVEIEESTWAEVERAARRWRGLCNGGTPARSNASTRAAKTPEEIGEREAEQVWVEP